MKLDVGQRLPGSGPSSHPGGYVVTAVAAETPWYGLYTAQKICYHFDFTAQRPREADEAEWLDVYLRTVHYLRCDDPVYVAARRTLARAELRHILGNRTSNLWPEPLDLIEIPNNRDPFTFSGPADRDSPVSPQGGTEPIIVFARPRGEPLSRWQQTVQPVALVLGVLAELLDFIGAAHGDGLLLNGLGPGVVVVDSVGRVHYLGSDMAVRMPAGTAPPIDWARFFPPERYPRGFSAPECFDPARWRDSRTDLFAWAALVYFVLTHDRPAQLALEQGQPWVRFGPPQWEKLEPGLRAIPPAHVRGWGEQLRVDDEMLVRRWPHNLLTILRRTLDPDPHQRPATVAEWRAALAQPEAPARVSRARVSGEEGKRPGPPPPKELPEEAEVLRAKQLCQDLRTVPDRDRRPALAALAEEVAARGNGPRLAQTLAGQIGAAEEKILPAWLSLELTARLPAPLPTALIAAVRPLLSLKRLPLEVRLDAAVSLLRATGKAGPGAAEVLQALVGGSGKARAIERLRLLEKRVGNSPAIDDLCARLEDQIRMICPRCSIELIRPAMRKHLWDEHRLILDGRRVRGR